MKAEWHNVLSDCPIERRHDYELYEALVDESGGWIATIEQFKANPNCFYANTGNDRSGCLGSHDWARQWCETKTGNKVN